MAHSLPAVSDPRSDSTPLVAGLCAREAWAERELLVQYTSMVERVVLRITGSTDADLEDGVQEVFVRICKRIATLRDPNALPGFVKQTAVFVARECLRSRRRKRWLHFFSPESLPENATNHADDRVHSAARSVYRIVDSFGDDDRILFLLRHVEGMELTELAEVCDTSLSTVKRRLKDAEQRFSVRASACPDLLPWMEGSDKWTSTR